MRVGFHTFGCKLNQHETEALASAFRGAGHAVGTARADADLYLVNTCTVTSKGDHKARTLVRSLLRAHPEAAVVVTGCSAQLEAAALAALGDRVVVVPQDRKDRLLGLADHLRIAGGAGSPQAEEIRRFTTGAGSADPFAFRVTEPSFHTRAFLKVQDGCDRRCAYCRVPLARGHATSLPSDVAVDRAVDLEARGFREIVLTGVNIAAWRETGSGLSLLVARLLAGTRRARIRVSSLEPEAIDDQLAAVLADPRVCPHFHLPVQSGSDRMLAAMGRRYDSGTVVSAVALLRRVKDDPFVAADMLTGFPGESDEDFALSRRLVERLAFARLHVFPFSPRAGTAAEELPGQVAERIRGERAGALGSVSRRLAEAYRERWEGREVEALLERGSAGRWLGVTGNYLKAWIGGVPASACKGSLIRAVVGRADGDGRYLGTA